MVLLDGNSREPWLLLAAGVTGSAIGILVAVFGKNGESSGARLARCTMGFIVAVVWIMAIADEVVEVLQVSLNFSVVIYRKLSRALDVRIDFRPLRRYYWSDHIRDGQFTRGPCCQYECRSKSGVHSILLLGAYTIYYVGLCTNHGLLRLFRWSHAQYLAWCRRRWNLHYQRNFPSLPSPLFHHPGYNRNRPPRPAHRNAHLRANERLLPPTDLGHRAHCWIHMPYGCERRSRDPVTHESAAVTMSLYILQ